MSDYSKMTDEELNDASAEMMGLVVVTHYIDLAEKHQMDYYQLGDEVIGPVSMHIGWCPTNQLSNQAERYLFPKLSEKCRYVVVDYLMGFVGVRKLVFREEMSHHYWNGLNSINRTKTIACLEAWEKLNV